MEQTPEAKSARLLSIYARFLSGQTLNKALLADEYGVTERSIQRDMESLRCFLAEQHLTQDIVYDRRERGYRLVNSIPKGLTNSEILAVCKILLESRSMTKAEMMPILNAQQHVHATGIRFPKRYISYLPPSNSFIRAIIILTLPGRI